MRAAAFRTIDLFSGIGGFSLGLERAGGFKTVAFCEINPFCRRVLAKHWPGVPCYDDVRTITAERLAADGIAVDVICGGFPCQDISFAGKGSGIEGERSGLWAEIARLSGELRPQYVIVENVSALLSRGLDKVLGDLATLGFDAEWHCIPASALGAPHRRDRFWLVAYAAGERRGEAGGFRRNESKERTSWRCEALADSDNSRRFQQWGAFAVGQEQLADECSRWWIVEPDVGRVAHGVPNRVDRLRSLGNAVVPQIPEMIGRAILALEERTELA